MAAQISQSSEHQMDLSQNELPVGFILICINRRGACLYRFALIKFRILFEQRFIELAMNVHGLT